MVVIIRKHRLKQTLAGYSFPLEQELKQRTRKQEQEQNEAENISPPSPALCGALSGCLPHGVGKGLGAERFDFSEIAPALRAALDTAWECGVSAQRVSAQAEQGAGRDCIMLFCASVSPSYRAEMMVALHQRGWLTPRKEEKQDTYHCAMLLFFSGLSPYPVHPSTPPWAELTVRGPIP